MIYVATARWCENHWVIAAGHDENAVRRDAELRVKEPHDLGFRDGGTIAEDFIIEKVEESQSPCRA